MNWNSNIKNNLREKKRKAESFREGTLRSKILKNLNIFFSNIWIKEPNNRWCNHRFFKPLWLLLLVFLYCTKMAHILIAFCVVRLKKELKQIEKKYEHSSICVYILYCSSFFGFYVLDFIQKINNHKNKNIQEKHQNIERMSEK